MYLTWYGTASFRFETEGRIFLIDPYLTRNAAARPALPIGPLDVTAGREIYISHGHFDHMCDAPQIARQTGAVVHCSPKAAGALRNMGVDEAQIAVARDGDTFDFCAYQAQCFDSTHIKPDLPLLAATLFRSLPQLPALWPLLRDWPRGQTLAWRFTLPMEDDMIIHHFGSAGCTEGELRRLADLDAPDVLLIPLQGHTQIYQIASRIVEYLQPRIVVPHHHNDFYPPISQTMDLSLFVESVKIASPSARIIKPRVCQRIEI